MSTIDTIYVAGDLLVGKVSGCNDVLPIVIKQTTEPCCENTKEIVGMLCDAMVPIVLIAVVGWLIWKIVTQCQKNKNADNERKFKERESLMKQRQDYQARILDEFLSYKKICDFIEDEKRKIEKKKKTKEEAQQTKNDDADELDTILQRIGTIGEDYSGKLTLYIKELDDKIDKLNKELGIKTAGN